MPASKELLLLRLPPAMGQTERRLLLSTALLIITLATDAAAQVRWCYLSDNPRWRSISSDPSQTFAVECTDACLQKKEPIWGTEVYTYDSNICRAALHDGRLSLHALDKGRLVRIQRQNDPRSYLGSVRLGVSSESYGQLGLDFGAYHFTSPRITEEIIDMTTVLRPATYTDRDDVSIACHARTNAEARELSFGIEANIHYSPGFDDYVTLPEEARVERIAQSNDHSQVELVLPSSVNHKRTGAFHCTCTDCTLSRVVSLAMRTDAYLVPEMMTKTVSVGDADVTLSVATQFSLPRNAGLRWWKDGEDLKVSTSQLLIAKVRLGHAGIYSTLYRDSDVPLDRRALMRLIVRACPDGKFGPSCDRRCSVCLNGGICHELTGECICPPGFHGPACDTPCGPNRFGRDCSAWCTEKDAADGCQGALLCLPDPYGCSCAAGFTGIKCSTYCRSGTFGAGCTQTCGHCLESTACDRFTGVCPSGCVAGWRGPRCTIALPYLRNPPVLLEATSDSLTVAWSAWDPATDPGDGHAMAYILQHKEKGTNEWNEIRLPEHIPHGNFNYTIKNLKAERDYQVRVLVFDQSGIIFNEAAPVAVYSTVCEGPLEPPPNITLEAINSKQLLVTWQVPPVYSWRCRDVTFTVRYHSNNDDESKRVTDFNNTRYVIKSPPFTEWTVQVRTENLAGFSNWSKEITSRTGQDAPGVVSNLLIKNEGLNSIFVSWEKPTITNGIISQFEVAVKLLHRKACTHHPSYEKELKEPFELTSMANVTATSLVLSGLEGYADYIVSIRAYTILPGQYISGVITTLQSVPRGKPVNLRFWYSYETELGFMWDGPSCEYTEGLLTAYLCIVKGVDPWLIKGGEHRYIVEHKHVKVSAINTTVDGIIRIKFLKPYSTYSLRVYAGTSVGFGNVSASTMAKTDPDLPPPPTNVSIYAKSWMTFSLVWSPPYPPNGEQEMFVIYLEPCPPYTVCNATVPPKRATCSHPLRQKKFCFTWEDLIANQTYSSWVKVKNKGVIGYSEPSEVVTVVTVESIPGPPSFLQFWNVESKSLIIRWVEPLITDGIITHYRVNLSSVEQSSNGTNYRLLQTLQVLPGASNMEFAIKGLQPNTKYRAAVEASTSAGYGDAIWQDIITSPHKSSAGSYSSDTGQKRNNPGNNPHHHYGYKDNRPYEEEEEERNDTDSDIILVGIIGTAISILVLLVLVILVLYILKRKSRQRLANEDRICRSDSTTNIAGREQMSEMANNTKFRVRSTDSGSDVPKRSKESIM